MDHVEVGRDAEVYFIAEVNVSDYLDLLNGI